MNMLGDSASLVEQIHLIVEDEFTHSMHPGSYEQVLDPFAAYGFRMKDRHVEHALRLAAGAVRATELVARRLDEIGRE